MSDTEGAGLARHVSGYAPPFLLGIGLLFLVRLVERRWGGGLLASSLLEEAVKGGLFLAVALALRLGKGRLSTIVSPELLPLVCIVGFAVTENLLYLLHAATTDVYERLLYAYPVHLNTGLLYATVFLFAGARALPRRAPRAWRLDCAPLPALAAIAALVAGTAYHLALNVLALVISGAAVYAVGAVNLLVLALLFVNLQRMRVERSLCHAGL